VCHCYRIRRRMHRLLLTVKVIGLRCSGWLIELWRLRLLRRLLLLILGWKLICERVLSLLLLLLWLLHHEYRPGRGSLYR